MQLTFTGTTALRLLRIARSRFGKRGLPRIRVALADPDPSPRKRWNGKLLAAALANWDPGALGNGPLHVCTTSDGRRIGSRHVRCTVYDRGFPPESFLPLDESLRIASPELLFVELADKLTLAEHLLLGFELCGTYTRDADAPVQGKGSPEFLPRPRPSASGTTWTAWAPSGERSERGERSPCSPTGHGRR